jgi:murein DD-endopeptidase MepM/ murein hydrolase activator NlpD
MHPAPAHRRPPRRAAAAARSARRRAILVAIGVGLVIVLAVAAFRPGGRPAIGASTPASATRLLPPPPPAGLALAVYGRFRVASPVNEGVVTAIGYHGAGDDALPFEPVGHQANAGIATRVFRRIFGGGGDGVSYYQLGGGQGPSTGALDVGAPSGTDVYAPTDGTVVGLRDYVLNGRAYGSVIDIQPAGEPSVVLSISHVQADPSLTVGSPIAESTSRIGTVIDLSGAERLALAQYTRDAGNYVELVLHPAGSVPLS